jgi:NADH-quinone oxidoreductase subunit E
MHVHAVLINEIVDRYRKDGGMLIPMLQDIQAEFGYLPQDRLKELSAELELPLMQIYGVSTFYSSFRLAPKGQHELTLCMGTVCFLKGADKIAEAICGEYNIQAGETTADRLFTFSPVNCVGACALAPVVVIDGSYLDHMTPESTLEAIEALRGGEAENGATAETDIKSGEKGSGAKKEKGA